MKKSLLIPIARMTLKTTNKMYKEDGIGTRCGYISGERSLPKAFTKAAKSELPKEK